MSNLFAAAATDDAQGENPPEPCKKLLALIKASTPTQQLDFSDFLQQISESFRESLFTQLALMAEENSGWWATVLAFFPEPHKQEALSRPQTHYQHLALSLLHSEKLTDKKAINQLSLWLSNTQLVALVNQLKRQKAHQYDQLLLALTIRAMRNPAEYQSLIYGHPDLANELMAKRLQKQPEKHKTLITEILNQPQQFNWNDPLFLHFVSDCIKQLFFSLNPAEIKPLFNKYFKVRQQHSHELSRMLDELANHHGDLQLISDCILQNDDQESQTFCYFYLINSEVKHQELQQTLLEQLTLKNLVKIGPHIVATRQIREQGHQSFTLIYGKTLFNKIRQCGTPELFLTELAENFACLEDNRDTITALFTSFQQKIDLQLQWLIALIKTEIDKSQLFELIVLLLPKINNKKKIELLNALNPLDFNRLYLFMLSQQKQDADYSIFYQVIKDKKQSEKLLHILAESPQIKFTIEDSLFDNESLLKLLKIVSQKVINDTGFEQTMEQISLIFCHRLLNTKDAIHQQINYTDAPDLSHYLLNNPRCFALLCERSTVLQNRLPDLLQNWVVSGASDDLKARIVRLLNEATIDEKQSVGITLRLLAHHQNQPVLLQSLFINLYDAQKALNDQGMRQFLALQRSCWEILMPEMPFVEQECKRLLCKQLATAHRFAPLSARLATIHAQDSKLGAQYLLQTPAQQLRQIDTSALVSILLYSTDESTQANWQKIMEVMNDRSTTQSLDFVQKLLAVMIKNPNNPQLNQQVWSFLLCLKHFNSTLVHLETDELCWLITHCEPETLTTYFSAWLTQLIDAKRFPPLKMVSLCQVLPSDEEQLLTLYESEPLNGFLHVLFIEFTQIPASSVHLLAIQQAISTQSVDLKRQFILLAQQKLPVPTLNSDTLALLMMLFFSLPALQSDNHQDVSLVEHQLNFLHAYSSPSERLQLLINLLNQLNNQDGRWANVILNSLSFARLIPHLLPQEHHTIRYHPFSTLLLRHTGNSFHPNLMEDNTWQSYLETLLSNPPETITTDQFALLFSQVNPQRQRQLALQRLGGSMLDSERKPILYSLANVLSVDELYTVGQEGKSPYLFVELISQHRDGIEALTVPQRNALLQHITDQKQLGLLLTNQSSTESKIKLVASLFDYLADSEQSVDKWLNQLMINGKVLAELANHCTNKTHQKKLNHVIDQRKELLQYYLNNPHVQQPLIKDGLLYHYVRHALLRADTSWHCHPYFFLELTAVDQEKALKNQWNQIKAISHLDDFFTPFEKSAIPVEQLYTAARWLQLLPLLGHVSKELPNHYTSRQELVSQILKLYQSRAEEDPEDLIALYFLHDKALILSSSKFLSNLFASQANHDEGFSGSLPVLTVDYKDQLNDGLTLHQQALAGKAHSTPQQLNALLANVLSAMHKHHDRHFVSWFIKEVLLSRTGHLIDPSALSSLLSELPLDFFCQIMAACYQRQTQIDSAYLKLQPLMTATSAMTVFNTLQPFPLAKLRALKEVASLAQLPYLTQFLTLAQHPFNEQQSRQLLLAHHCGQQAVGSWIQQEINQLKQFANAHSERCLQLVKQALSYQDDKSNWQRLSLLTTLFFLPEPTEFLVPCLDSYSSFFNQQASLDAINPLIIRLIGEPAIIQQLDKKLYTSLLLHLLKDVENQQKNIYRLLANRGGKLACGLVFANLKAVIHHMLPQLTDTPPLSLADLSPENLLSFSAEQLNQLLIHQSIVFYLQPVEELQSWQLLNLAEKEQRTLFCQEASLYATFNQLAHSIHVAGLSEEQAIVAQARLQQCLQFLKDNSKKWQYLGLLDQFSNDEIHHFPSINYHRLTLLSFLAETPQLLLCGFIEWLNLTPHVGHVYLQQTLYSLLKTNLLASLCQILQENPLDSAEKSDWLCNQIVQSQLLTPQLIGQLVTVCTWPWLINQLRTAGVYRSHFLSAAFQSDRHREALLASQTSESFLHLLQACPLPVNELIKILQTTTHPPIKNLLALHLLSRQDYLSQLKSVSFLDKPGKKRLQALINCVDLEQTPFDALRTLQPEAAASLFCSLRHLHQLNEERLLALFQQFPAHKEAIVLYWLTHYADKPNAANVLIVLGKHHSATLIKSLAACEISQARHLKYLLLRQLPPLEHFKIEDFKPYDVELLSFALQLFLYSPAKDKHQWVAFIKANLNQFQHRADSPNKEILHWLIQLSETADFKDYEPLQDLLGTNVLQHNAFLQDCSLFYDDHHFQARRALKKLKQHEIKKEDGIVQTVYGLFKMIPKTNFHHYLQRISDQLIPDQLKQPALLRYLQKNSVLQTIAVEFSAIPSFNYFLIHYAGSFEELAHCLHDYLSCFLRDSVPAEHIKLLQSTAWLINQSDIDLLIRKTVFNAFLKFPKLIDTTIIQQLLQFDADETLKVLGQLPYAQFISLCSSCEPLLTNSPTLLQQVQHAKSEACFEQALSKMSGWFLALRVHLKRCFFYPWEGWFTPKAPEYVNRFEQAITAGTVALSQWSKSTTAQTYSNQLPELLQQLSLQPTLVECKALIFALKRYNLITMEETSPFIRQKVQEYFQLILLKSATDLALQSWLQINKDDFIDNRGLLAGFYWKTQNHEALNSLLQENRDVLSTFQELADASEVELITDEATQNASIINTIANTLCHTFNSFWSSRPAATISSGISHWFKPSS